MMRPVRVHPSGILFIVLIKQGKQGFFCLRLAGKDILDKLCGYVSYFFHLFVIGFLCLLFQSVQMNIQFPYLVLASGGRFSSRLPPDMALPV